MSWFDWIGMGMAVIAMLTMGLLSVVDVFRIRLHAWSCMEG